MRHTIPQFIEHEAKIIGPLTFKQFFTMAFALIICLFLWAMIPSITIFIICSVVIVGGTATFTFVKIGGRPFSTVFKNFLAFSFLSSKKYLWKKKKPISLPVSAKKTEQKPRKTEIKEEKKGLKMQSESKLADIKSRIETT